MDDDLPVFPGFRELARRRREMLAELVEQRRAAGLSQAEVAGRMGTSQPAVARLEAGEVDVRMSTVERYAAAIGRRLELRFPQSENEPGRQP
jgi:predicted transcriptional regulator